MRILAYDIETAPNTSYTWGKYEQNVLSFVQESYMLCYAYKWLDEKTTHVIGLPDFPTYKKDPTDDKALTTSLWELFNEADIIIAHNGDAFDIKYSNGRFLYHKLVPPTTYRTIDTLKIARRRFKLNSNKLNDLGEVLNVGKKVETGGFQLWLDCMAGCPKAWKKMKRYNKQDVDLLIEVYERLKPWVPNHPNLNVEHDAEACSVCQSEHLVKAGFVFTNAAKQQRWKCVDCGANLYTSLKGNKPPKAA